MSVGLTDSPKVVHKRGMIECVRYLSLYKVHVTIFFLLCLTQAMNMIYFYYL